MDFLRFLEEDSGIPSHIRLISFLWAFVVLVTWSGMSVYRGQLLPIPESVAMILLLLVGAKVGQKALEKPAAPAK